MKLSKANSYNKGCVVDGGLNFQMKHVVYYYVWCVDVVSLDVEHSRCNFIDSFDVLYNSIPPN